MAASHALPPLRTDPEALRAGLLARLRRDPRAWGEERSRWTLAGLRAHDPDVADYSVAGLWRLLRRLAIHWKRGRDHLHSPDPDYDAKLASLAVCRAEVAAAPDRVRLVFLDELTYYRQPTIGWGYAAAGSAEPWAQRTPRFNTPTRVLGALDPTTGQVTAVQGRTLGVAALVPFYAQLCTAAPEVTRWYVVQDNWPVHTHPDLLVELEPQTAPVPWYRPRSRPTEPSPRAGARWGEWA